MKSFESGWRVGNFTLLMQIPQQKWMCVCDCGNVRFITRYKLFASGPELKCRPCLGLFVTKHGHARSKAITISYRSWLAMRYRCEMPSATGYEYYGGRGIKVCDRWSSFASFLSDMGERPSLDHTIDRIDGEQGYFLQNCRWATSKEQRRNRTDTRFIEYEGRVMCLADWAAEKGLRFGCLRHRIEAAWDLHDAMTKPSKRSTTTKEESK